MSVKKEPSGRRSVQVEVEVPGTPDQVWQAIATGPGISSWFVPAKVEGRVGGALQCDFGGGMVSSAKVTVWEPPHRFVAEDSTWLQGGPAVATEWTVEAKTGGTCVVRVVHSLFASTDDWDGQIEGTEHGWPGYFRVLRYMLTHHRGQRSATMQATAFGKGSPRDAWVKLTRALSLPKPAVGQRTRVQAPGAAALVATVERVDEMPQGHALTLAVTEPAPGLAITGAYDCMGMLMASMQVFFYGDRAESAARDTERWQQWLRELFPAEQAAS